MAGAVHAAATVLRPRVFAAGLIGGSASPSLPPLRFSPAPPFPFSNKPFSEPLRLSLLQRRASSSEETTGAVDSDELLAGLKEKWDAVENKPTVILYGGGAIVAVWISTVVVGAVNSVPLLPKMMELVGLGYTAWFVYRYLLFKSSRKELAAGIAALKKKVAGME